MNSTYDCKTGILERMICAHKNIFSRRQIKVALKQMKDWINGPQRPSPQYADYHTIEERMREHKLKCQQLMGVRFY